MGLQIENTHNAKIYGPQIANLQIATFAKVRIYCIIKNKSANRGFAICGTYLRTTHLCYFAIFHELLTGFFTRVSIVNLLTVH
jgi:hypothetical protein